MSASATLESVSVASISQTPATLVLSVPLRKEASAFSRSAWESGPSWSISAALALALAFLALVSGEDTGGAHGERV